MSVPSRLNRCWAMDFIHDVLPSGRRYRMFNAIDVRSREFLVCESDSSFLSRRVIQLLNAIGLERKDRVRQRPGVPRPHVRCLTL
jgi:putative transposase